MKDAPFFGMYTEITIDNLRILEHVIFKPRPGLNLISGKNGAGKTTMLEALYMLASGRSFRHRDTTPLIREGQAFLQVVAKFNDLQGNPHVLGMRRDRENLLVRLDGRGNVKRSEILHLLPLQFIGADPQQLISGAPELRRTFLDGGLFHVEHGYLKLMQRYGRVLSQRNAILRSGSGDTGEWDPQLIELGTTITEIRRSYVRNLVEHVQQILSNWAVSVELSFSYRDGWAKGHDLQQALARAKDTDRKQHFTSVGPHRADLVIDARVAKSGKVLSRGQLKMTVIALYLAQAAIHRSVGKGTSLLLLDDLAAELDRANRGEVLNALCGEYAQIIVTALDRDDIPVEDGTPMFHVEQGSLFPE